MSQWESHFRSSAMVTLRKLKRSHSPNDRIPGENGAPPAVKKVKNTFTFR